EGELRFDPRSPNHPDLSPLVLSAGWSAKVFDELSTLVFEPAHKKGFEPWQPLDDFDALVWGLRELPYHEGEYQVGTGTFRSFERTSGREGHSFLSRSDILATTPVNLPDRFRIATRIRLHEAPKGSRTIIANAAMGAETAGFRIGFDHADSEETAVLRATFGDGKRGTRVSAPEFRFEYDLWYHIVVTVDALEGSVVFEVNGKKGKVRESDLPPFRRSGSLYFGGREPSDYAGCLLGEMLWLRLENLSPTDLVRN
ncbi:MAG: LamG-like jellyroll fold domain-containing protein, partial [Verrucomicrobiota bacterium]